MSKKQAVVTIPCTDGLVLGIEHNGQMLVQVCTPEMVAQLDDTIAKFKLGLHDGQTAAEVLAQWMAQDTPGTKAETVL